jgi:tetratricopeptide (TPR) repeat protein
MEKPKSNNKGKAPAVKPAAAPAPAPVKLPPLFRRMDWLVLLATFVAIWTAYLLTLAPNLTLEDSGELCTASFYAGIPHPPGYPFWAIYSWIWTVIVPFGSVTWRVEVGESFAAAMACGLVGLMVSRGSSMLIEGIEDLKTMNRKWENAICVVCGITAGLLLGFDNYMWKESVVINRISVFDVPWLMVVAVCLFRWIYAPHQRRYLYIAMFFFGVCFTIHQTMLCAAMGIETAVAVTNARLGRTFMLANSAVYIAIVVLMKTHAFPFLEGLSPTLLALLHLVGVASMAAYVWLAILTKADFVELCRDGALAGTFLFAGLIPTQGAVCVLLALAALGTYGVLAWNTWKLERGWLVVIICGLLWMVGVSFYFYEPISGMTVPPMQWGYPRTVEGFWHAFTRGQYEKANPTDIFSGDGFTRFIEQLWMVLNGLAGSFSWVCLFIAALPFVFFFRMQKRERAWIISLSAIYACVGVLLTVLMNTTPDRQSADENKVFFTASHAVIAILIGYGLALLATYMATHYQRFRSWGFIGGGVAAFLGIICLWQETSRHYFGNGGEIGLSQAGFGPSGGITLFDLPHWIVLSFEPNQFSLPVYAYLILAAIPFIFILALVFYRSRAPMVITLGLFLAVPVYSGLTHWNKGEERNHWFGYWFGHDMFTPPFETPDLTPGANGKTILSYDPKLREQAMKDPKKGYLVYPEMDRNTILFGGTDPGRFCPTYMIFCESFIPAKDKPMDPNFDRRDVYLITQNALADGTYLDYLRSQYFRSQQHDPPFFREFVKQAGNSAVVNSVASIAYNVLDVPFTKLGAKVEARRRAEGVYPPAEIYIPSPEDSAHSFEDYTRDVAKRQAEGRLQPGEDVQVDPASGRVQVSGQVAVMMINGLLCRVIFDKNPTNSFYVEESFPLEWMYPYETPFGIIMKINRDPLVALPDDVYKRDHEFWSKYTERLIGNWITYDTSVQQIADWVQKVYLRNDFTGFTGDRKFIRDDDAQKAFSKLRSSQAGVYAWRLRLLFPNPPPDPQYMPYRPKSDAEVEQLRKECDFAFKQSLAFCPYSPEAVIRYVNFLFQFQRFDDALIVAQTCQKLDPYNGQITGLINQITNIQAQISQQTQNNTQATTRLQQAETEAHEHPTNVQNLLMLGSAYIQMQRTNDAVALFENALTNSTASYPEVSAAALFYSRMGGGYVDKLEVGLQKLLALSPEPVRPEAYYDLAALKAMLGKTNEALDNLRNAVDLSVKRLQANPGASDLVANCRTDPRFDVLRSLPEFQKIIPLK